MLVNGRRKEAEGTNGQGLLTELSGTKRGRHLELKSHK